ncbi:unnamed protein product, partial [Tilletia laevis]
HPATTQYMQVIDLIFN